MLTKFLLKGNYDLKVVEADRDMVAYLKEHYPELNGKIIESDFLKVHLEEEMKGKPFFFRNQRIIIRIETDSLL